MLNLEFTELSDTGRTRKRNEDFVGHLSPASPDEVHAHGWLFVLADGVGGHQHGDVASKAAVESVIHGFCSARPSELHSSLLPRLVQSANAAVYEAGSSMVASGHRMATTLVACAVRFDSAVVAHVGDSRCYLIRRGKAKQLTLDHTLANMQSKARLYARTKSFSGTQRHVLSRSIGADADVKVDVTVAPVMPGDVLLLCSDGLHGALLDEELAEIVTNSRTLESAAKSLVDLANEHDGGDNVSVQLARVLSVERMGLYRGRPYKIE